MFIGAWMQLEKSPQFFDHGKLCSTLKACFTQLKYIREHLYQETKHRSFTRYQLHWVPSQSLTYVEKKNLGQRRKGKAHKKCTKKEKKAPNLRSL